MQKSQKGFTLIELMIVVAIIAILAAIAIPQYQNYVIRSQVARVVAETGDLKTVVEDCLNNGKVGTGDASGTTTCDASVVAGSSLISSTDAPQGGQTAATGAGYPQLTVAAASSSIVALLGNSASASIAGATVTWTRDTNGTWTCAATSPIVTKWAAQGCPVTATSSGG